MPHYYLAFIRLLRTDDCKDLCFKIIWENIEAFQRLWPVVVSLEQARYWLKAQGLCPLGPTADSITAQFLDYEYVFSLSAWIFSSVITIAPNLLGVGKIK